MKLPLAACVAIFAASCDDPTPSTPSSPDPAPPSVEVPKSPELQVLDRFVGTWDFVGIYTPAGGEKVPFQRVRVSHRKWSTNGTTLHFDEPGSGPDDPGVQSQQSYDSEKKNYTGVVKSALGRGEFTGTWDEETKTMSFIGTYEGGATTFEGSNRFIDADTVETKFVFKKADGELFIDLNSKQTRRKPLGKAPTVEELIASYHESIGGLEANKKITTRRREGTFSQFDSPPEKITVIQKAPDLGLTKIEIAGFGEALEGTDGKVVWKSNPVEGTVELQGAERVQKLRDYQFHKYLDLKSEFKTLTSKGRETMEGTTYDVLEAVREDGSSEMLFFHAWKHQLALVKLADFTIEMTNYREIDGIFYSATTSVVLPDGRTVMVGNFTKIEHGIKVDDSLFGKPKE